MSDQPDPGQQQQARSVPRPRTTVTGVIGRFFSRLRDLVARALIALGITPNQITIAGLALSAAAGISFALGLWGLRLGAVLILAAGACDMLDGAVAKLGRQDTKFGAMLDSSLDRYSDGFLFGGLIWYWAAADEALLAGLAISALVGALVISYTRARAENVIDSCKVGFWERGERTVLLLLASAAGTLPAAILVLGTLTHLSALQRILHTRWVLEGRRHDPPEGGPRWVCWWVLHRLLLWDYPRASVPYDIAALGIIVFVGALPFSG